jgi:hypothetical protein
MADFLWMQGRWVLDRLQARIGQLPDLVAQPKVAVAITRIRKPEIIGVQRRTGALP